MVGLTPPPHDWVGNDGKPIYFDSIDNSAYILGKAPHSARNSWVYIDGEKFQGVRADIGGDPKRALGAHRMEIPLHGEGFLAGLGGEPGFDRRHLQPHHGPVREIRHDLQRGRTGADADHSPGRYAGQDNGWVLALIEPVILDFDKIDHEVSEHQAVPGRRLERPGSGPSDIPTIRFPC